MPRPNAENPSAPAPERGLRRQLSAGQMTMVAVGGSIGTGLLLGSAAAIGIAGSLAFAWFGAVVIYRIVRPARPRAASPAVVMEP